MTRKIYLASSWRNNAYPSLLYLLRDQGHEVYDFKDPSASFYWANVDHNWKNWSAEEAWTKLNNNEEAIKGFERDAKAVASCDTLVLVMPCGRSAHVEMGVAVGLEKDVAIFVPPAEKFEAELMHKYANFMTSDFNKLFQYLEQPVKSTNPRMVFNAIPKSYSGCIFVTHPPDGGERHWLLHELVSAAAENPWTLCGNILQIKGVGSFPVTEDNFKAERISPDHEWISEYWFTPDNDRGIKIQLMRRGEPLRGVGGYEP